MSKFTYWKCTIDICGLELRLPCQLSAERLAKAVRHEALLLRLDAERLTATNDNGELAGGLLERAKSYKHAADEIEARTLAGALSVEWQEVQATAEEQLQKQSVETLSHEASRWTLHNIDCYPRVALWLRYVGLVYALNLYDVLEMLAGEPGWRHPFLDFIETKLKGN